MYEELVKSFRCCTSDDPNLSCEGNCEYYDICHIVSFESASAHMLADAANAIEELLKAAKAMHTWIFLNTGDEQKAYDECGLSDEMNAALGYGGQFVMELPKEG